MATSQTIGATGQREAPRWHRVYPACLDCGDTEKRHVSRGLCTTCANNVNKPGYDGNAAPPATGAKAGGRVLSQEERDEIAVGALARARERGWVPLHEREARGDMKGWAGKYHACRDCGSDKRPHSEDGYCTLCHMERNGHKPTALEVSLLNGAEPPLALATGTSLPPDAPAPPARILPMRRDPEPQPQGEGAARRVHAEAMERARVRHQATFGPDAAPPPEIAVPLPEPEVDPETKAWRVEPAPATPEETTVPETIAATCGNTWRYDDGNTGPPCALPEGHEGCHTSADNTFQWFDQPAPNTPATNGAAIPIVEKIEEVDAAVTHLSPPVMHWSPSQAPAPPQLVREEIEQGEALPPVSGPTVPPATGRIALAEIPTDALVAELQRRREATRRTYDEALAAMESLNLALDALSAPAATTALRG